MVIGFLSIEIHFPYTHSLKDKRKILNRLRDRITQRFNVAFAELDFQDKWQRTKVGVVTLNSQQKIVEQTLSRIVSDTEQNIEGDILHHETSYF